MTCFVVEFPFSTVQIATKLTLNRDCVKRVLSNYPLTFYSFEKKIIGHHSLPTVLTAWEQFGDKSESFFQSP